MGIFFIPKQKCPHLAQKQFANKIQKNAHFFFYFTNIKVNKKIERIFVKSLVSHAR